MSKKKKIDRSGKTIMTIREAKVADLPALAQVFVQVYEAFDVGERWTKKSALKMLKHCMERRPSITYVVEDEYSGEIIGGFTVAIKPWWDGNHMVDGEIFVHPDYQGCGIGSALTELVFREALKRYEVKRWDTYTFRGSEHPLSWYKKLGFTENKDWVMISGDVEAALKILE